MNGDFHTIKKVLFNFLRSILWLTMVAWMPPYLTCKFNKYFGITNKYTALLSFFIASLFIMLDQYHKIYQTGLFLAPKFLELFYGMLILRGFMTNK